MEITAVLFDFDGLLMDTEGTGFASWQHEWRQHGLELDASTFSADHGGDVSRERYARLAEAAGPGYDQAASHARRLAYRAELHAHLGLLPGIGAWLGQARAAGLRLAVASASPLDWVHGLLSGIGRATDFEVFACGDEVASPKPAPDVYALALRRLGLGSGQAVAVEDSPHGAVAARAAGLRCIAIPNDRFAGRPYDCVDLILGSAADMPLAAALALATGGAGG